MTEFFTLASRIKWKVQVLFYVAKCGTVLRYMCPCCQNHLKKMEKGSKAFPGLQLMCVKVNLLSGLRTAHQEMVGARGSELKTELFTSVLMNILSHFTESKGTPLGLLILPEDYRVGGAGKVGVQQPKVK